MARPKDLCEACYPGNACPWCMQKLGHRAVELAMLWDLETQIAMQEDPLVIRARRLVATLGEPFGSMQFTPEDLLGAGE